MEALLKVGYIHRSLGASYGGALIDLLRVLKRLDRSIIEPRVVLSHGLHHADRFRDLGLTPVHIPLPAMRKAKSLPTVPFALARLTRWLIQSGVDLLHVNDADDVALAAWACRLARIPCVVHVRSEMEPRKFRRLRVHRADYVLAVSNRVKRAAVEGGVDPARVRVLHSGVAVPPHSGVAARRQQIRAGYQLEGKVVVGAVANLSPVKDPQVFVEAMALVCARYPEVLGLWIGADDHGLRPSLEQRAEQLGIRTNLVFTGFQFDVEPFFAAMDAFVSTSREEGYGLVLLEAMAHAIPVVATRTAGACEIIADGKTGVLVPVADPSSLAKAILGVLEDRAFAKEIAEAGFRSVVERFSIERQVATTMLVYRMVRHLYGRVSDVSQTKEVGLKPDAAPGVHEKAVGILTRTGSTDRKILDLPCGHGALAAALLELGYHPDCADITTEQFRVPGAQCTRADLNARLPFPDASYDDWVCVEGIEHVENPHLLIREAQRILRPGGRLIISTPNTLSVKSRYFVLRFGYPVHFDLMVKREQSVNGRLTVQHINPISFIELQFLLDEYGFAITGVEANKLEPRHRIRHGLISRFLVRRRPLGNDSPKEASRRRLLGTRTLLYGEILIVEAVKQ